MIDECAFCGKEFRKRSYNHKFCSQDCASNEANYPMTLLAKETQRYQLTGCANCDNSFDVSCSVCGKLVCLPCLVSKHG